MKILILITTLLLQGCLYAGIAAEIEYSNYVTYTEARGKTPMTKYEYWQWSAPKCEDYGCKVKNKDYRYESPK